MYSTSSASSSSLEILSSPSVKGNTEYYTNAMECMIRRPFFKTFTIFVRIFQKTCIAFVFHMFVPISKLFLKFSPWQRTILRRVFLAVALSSQNLELDI